MKVYISGRVSGMNRDLVKRMFGNAETLLNDLGFDVVNPLNNGIDPDAPWIDHITRDLALLHECDAIYMMADWMKSKGANVEYQFSIIEGKTILFESYVIWNDVYVYRLENAIKEVTDLDVKEYIIESKERNLFYARMLFAHHCRNQMMSLNKIARMIHRNHSTVIRLVNKYYDEVKYNPQFRELAESVNKIMKFKVDGYK